MRSTFSARVRKALSIVPAALLAFTLLPSTAFAEDGSVTPLAGELASTRTYALPAMSLSDAPAITIASGTVSLADASSAEAGADDIPAIRTTYVARGCVYTLDRSAGTFTLVNAANAELTEESYLIVPSALVLDGAEYPVANIAAGALSNANAVLAAFSSNVTSIDELAARGNAALQAFYVSSYNEAYASFDGCLYGKADESLSLLLIPEGKQGAVRIPSGAEWVRPDTFSHCVFVDSISVDAGSAAFSSRNDCLYSADGTQLLRVPAGANGLTIASECTFIERGALYGCTSLKTIMVEGRVEAIHPEAFARETNAASETEEGEGDDDPHLEGNVRTNETVTLASDDGEDELALDPASTVVVLANDDADAAVFENAGFERVVKRSELTDEELEKLLASGEGDQDAGIITESPLGSPIEKDDEPVTSLDIDSIVIPEDAFAPIVLPSDTPDAPASDSADSDGAQEGDADPTAPPSDAPGEPIEADEAEEPVRFTAENAATFAAALPTCSVTFNANGGVDGKVPGMVLTANGKMPSILNQYNDSRVPVRDKYVFMGFYDGSDYRSANRYYNPDFTQDGCTTDYAFSANGLVLYAGWAPTISVDVPTNVSVAVGSEPSIDAPTSTTATIKNMSPWDVKATSLTWDTASLQGSTAELTEMFENLSSLRFVISLTDDSDASGTVAPGGTTTQASDIGFMTLAKGSVAAPTEKSFDYTLALNEAAVAKTDVVSNTSLITVFEATDAPAEETRAIALFDANDDGASDYYLAPREMTYGETPSVLTMPDGSAFAAPEFYGHTFMGFFDGPVYDAEGTKRYFDESGNATCAWDKTVATVLYAGWSTDTGRVVFDGNGGYLEGDPSLTQKVEYVPYGASVASVIGEGYMPVAMFMQGATPVFSDAWYTDPIGGTRIDDFADVVVDDVDKPIVFYAHWDASSSASVPVTFVANGKNALVEGEERVTKSIRLGDFMASLPTAVRPGFTFSGWYTAAVGGIKIESAPPTLAALTLYAHWTGDEVTVSWDTGGWNVANPPSTTYTYTDDDTINTGYPSGGVYDAMDRGAGFTWNGWYAEAANGSLTGDKITSASKLPITSTTYHAFWDVALTWDAQNGEEPVVTTATLSTASPVVMPATDPVRAGYRFDGWFASATGGTQVTASTVVSAPATYYAHWTGNDYTVTIDKNANDAVVGTTSVQVKQGDMLPALDSVPTREGYTLLGFFDVAAGMGGTMYCTAAGTPVRAWDKAGDGTLYARWVNESTGGTAPTVPPTPVNPGEPDPTDPFHPETDYPKPGDGPTIVVTPPEGSSIMGKAAGEDDVARTLLSGTYHGSVMWNSGSAAPAASDSVVITLAAYQASAGNSFEEVANRFASNAGKYLIGFTAPSTGSFITWNDLSSGSPFMLKVKGSDLTTTAGLPSVSLNDGALKAVYADAPYQPVQPPTGGGELEPGSGVANSFDANGGSFANGAASQMVSAVVGETLNVPAVEPTRSGFDFDGWWTAADGGAKVDGATKAPNKATRYYAHWKGAAFKVTLDANANDIARYPLTVDVQFGAAMPNVSAGMPAREGFVFVGFFDTGAATGGKQYYTASGASARAWDKAEDATLYARWINEGTGGTEGGEDPFPPAPVEGPTILVTPQNGSAIKAEATDGANVSRTLFDGTYHGSVTWEGTGAAPADAERAVIRVDSYTASSAAPLDAALASFDAQGKYLLGFQAVSTGSFVAASDIRSGSSFELHVLGSDLANGVAMPSISLKQGSLKAVYSDTPVNPNPGPGEEGQAIAITYDAGQGSFANGARFAVTASVIGQDLSVPVEPSRAGHVFDGWFTLPTGGVGAPAVTPASATTYYAHWHARTYQLTFDKNGGTGGTDSASATYGSPLPSGVDMPSRTGYIFAGYFDTKAATGGKLYYSAFGGGQGIYDIAGDATFCARWIDEGTGGIPGEPGTDPFPGIDPTDPQPGQGPTIKVTPDAGSSIAGDAIDSAGRSQALFGGTYLGSVMWGSDAASPRADEDVVITVDSYAPGSGNDMKSVATRFETDGKWLLGFQVTSTGSFIGWDALKANTSFTFVAKGANLSGSATAPDVSLREGTLRAVYTSTPPGTGGNIEVVNTFDAGLGAFASGNRFEVKVSIAGGTLSLPSANPVREGYEFAGWYTASVGGDRIDVAPTPAAPATSTTYYAHWKGEPVVVSWYANTPADAEYSVQNVPGTAALERGQRLSAKYGDALPVPTLTHFRFDGWFTEAAGGSQVSASTIIREDTTDLYAHWTWAPNPCTVTFDVATNGGAGGPGTAVAVYKAALPEITGKPTKTGHTFQGFFDAASGGTRYYDADLGAQKSAWDKEESAVTLYAQFTANVYDVWFDANGGTGSVDSVRATYGAALPKPAAYTQPTRTGHTLQGFFDTSAATGGTKYMNADGTSAKNWDKPNSATLYARWSVNTYTVTLDRQSGTGGSSSATATYGAALPSITPPTRAGYTFGGYWTGTNGSGKQYYTAAGASANAWIETSNKTLYAKWTANTITLTWNSQGGSAVANTSKVYAAGAKVTMPSANPTRAGYTFKGWFTAASGGTQVTANTALPTVNTTYHAQWTANKITITWNSQGGSAVANTSATYSASTKVPMPSANPTKTGYAFKGWFTAASGGTQVTSNTALPTANTTYHAQWTANIYTIAFNGNGATSGSTASMSMTYGTAKNLTNNGFARTGYTFNGWNTAANGSGTNYSNGQNVKNLTATNKGTVTLYAKWTAKTSALTFNLQSGTGGGTLTGKKATYGSAMPTSGLSVPTRTGYTFAGYYDATSGGTQYYTAALASARNWNKDTTSGTTLYARWTAKTSALTFNLNGGTGTAPTGKKATYGSAMPSISGAPTRSGYKFLGYYDAASGGTQYYTAALASARNWNKDTTAGTTLYAHWEFTYKPTTSVPSGTDGDFYLYLTSAQASTVSSTKLTMQAGYYSATQIKAAATDIASNGTSSIYYEVYQKIMNNDIKFKSKWKDVDTHNANSVLTTTTEYDIRLIGLRQDYTNTGKTTFAGMTFQFANYALSYAYRYNNARYNSTGWQNSELRARMNSTNSTNCSPQPAGSYTDSAAKQSIWKRAPSAITSNIQPVYKFTHNATGNTSTAVTATRDQMFLASYWEMASTNCINNSPAYSWILNETVSGTQYQYWKAKNVSGNSENTSMEKKWRPTGGTTLGAAWWERTTYTGDALSFFSVSVGGYLGEINYADTNGLVVPCFCF